MRADIMTNSLTRQPQDDLQASNEHILKEEEEEDTPPHPRHVLLLSNHAEAHMATLPSDVSITSTIANNSYDWHQDILSDDAYYKLLERIRNRAFSSIHIAPPCGAMLMAINSAADEMDPATASAVHFEKRVLERSIGIFATANSSHTHISFLTPTLTKDEKNKPWCYNLSLQSDAIFTTFSAPYGSGYPKGTTLCLLFNIASEPTLHDIRNTGLAIDPPQVPLQATASNP